MAPPAARRSLGTRRPGIMGLSFRSETRTHNLLIGSSERDRRTEPQAFEGEWAGYYTPVLTNETVSVSSPSVFKSAFRSRGPLAILDHFDIPYSVLSQFRTVDPALQAQTLELLVKAVSRHSSDLQVVLEDVTLSPSDRLDHLNTLKMTCYLLTQFIEAFEDQSHKQELANIAPTGKLRKAKPKAWEFDWESERTNVVLVLTQLVQLEVRRLWSIGTVEEEFSRALACCCYRILENPGVGQAKNKGTRDAVAHLLGVMIKRYDHMLGATLNIIQLLQHFEHVAPVLVQAVTIWATEYGMKTIVGEIMREIVQSASVDTNREASGARCYAAFLVELAERIPGVMIPNVSLILDLLNGESYTLRNAVLSTMGEMLTRVLSGSQLDASSRETRDRFLDTLQLHLHDVHAFVRSRCVQVFTHIVQEKALPLKRFQALVTLATGRLCDKSVIVCKNAIQLLAAILANNPFTWKLSISDLNAAYEKELLKLTQMKEEQKGQVPAVVLEPGEEWEAMQPELLSTIRDVLAGEEEPESEREAVGPNMSAESVGSRIGELLKEAKYKRAVRLTLVAIEGFKGTGLFIVEDLDDAESEGSPRELDLLKTMEACFKDGEETEAEPGAQEGAQAAEPSEPSAEDPLPTPEPAKDVPGPSEQAKQEVLVQYLKDTLTFAVTIEGAIETVGKFLTSKNSSVVQEAIQFFVVISEFGISQALLGMCQMLPLVWSKEAAVKDAVTEAYRRLYLHSNGQSSKPRTLVQNLTALIFNATMDTIKCLEQLVSDFVQKGEVEPAVIQLLWERLTEKVACSAEERRAAVILLGMAARGEPEIVCSNLETLFTVGLGARAKQDYQLARDICLTIGKISLGKKVPPGGGAAPFRLPRDHPLFAHLSEAVTEGFASPSPHWRPFATAAVGLIYQLAETPDRLCCDLLLRCAGLLTDHIAPGEDREQALTSGQSPEGSEGKDCADSEPVLPAYLLTNLVSLAGHVGLQQMVHLERAVGPELHRRRMFREQREAKEKSRKGKAKDASASAIEDELGLAEASAEDTEAELVRKICDVELLDDGQLLSAFVPLIVKICSNPGKYRDPDLASASCLALCKMAMVSHDFCEQHLRLLFTMLEKSAQPSIRSNTMVALGDLSFRFPNLIEPWTSHLYARLRDSAPCVRRTALIVMTHLILKDMVKVKGQISEMAVLVIDEDEGIAVLARSFFNELSNKGNAVYNLLPDIISRLSDPECGVGEEPFQTIMRQMFSYITKDKQTESLVEKLCQRFRTAKLQRQYRDLAFCLALLPASDRGLRKMQENFECFADKLTEEAVYQHLMGIAGKLHRGIKPELKVLVDEFEQRLTRCHRRGLDDGDAGDVVTQPAVKGPCRAADKQRGGRARRGDGPVTPRVGKRRQPSRKGCVTFSSNEETEEEEEEESDGLEVGALDSEITPKMTSPIQRATRSTRSCAKRR
uniref:condensin complex subunit 1 isoform X2 n=1 Tax=Pristiophorus japonicus TaxID=55135 RepID=UPI00398F2381